MGHLGRTARPTANARARLPNMGTSFLRTPGSTAYSRVREEEPCQMRCRHPGETQFDDLEPRGLLDGGRAGHAYGSPALYLGLVRPVRIASVPVMLGLERHK